MFGSYRLILAFFVLLTHIGGIEVIGGLGVWGFFMLSGFLITGVLNKRYGFSLAGLFGFSISRFLRLFPTYWIVACATLITFSLFRAYLDPVQVNDAFGILEGLREKISAILIMGHTSFGIGRVDHAISPPIWAVEVEIFLYTISCFGVSSSEKNARNATIFCAILFPVLWLIAKKIFIYGFQDYGGQLLYSFVPAALLPYGIGSYLWFKKDSLPWIKPNYLIMFIIFFVIALIVNYSDSWSITGSYIISLPFLAFLLIAFSKLKNKGLYYKIDELFGHMSYPVYLSHYACAYGVLITAKRFNVIDFIGYVNDSDKYNYTFFGAFIIIASTFFISLFIAVLFEYKLNKLRHLISKYLVKLIFNKNLFIEN